jgi:hypothetical protein
MENDPPQLTIFLYNKGEEITHHIPNAIPLREALDSSGYLAEEAVKDSVAVWGMPDFVFSAKMAKISKTGRRELGGDGVVVSGDRALLISTKARRSPSGDVDRERAWFERRVRKAHSQALGSIRRLHSRNALLSNRRGRSVEIAGGDYAWCIVILIDYPTPPLGITVNLEARPGQAPAVVMYRRDWEFLYRHLGSTYAVVSYLFRVAGNDIELGTEPFRYHQVALADQNSASDGSHLPRFPESEIVSSVLAPLHPVSNSDLATHLVLRYVMESIGGMSLDSTVDERHRLTVLAALDSIPVAHRTDLGHHLVQSMNAATNDSSFAAHCRRYATVQDGRAVVLLFIVSPEITAGSDDDMREEMLKSHHEYREISGLDKCLTIAIMLAPISDDQGWKVALQAHGD